MRQKKIQFVSDDDEDDDDDVEFLILYNIQLKYIGQATIDLYPCKSFQHFKLV